MSNIEKRIAMLMARAAARREKAANLPAARKLNAGAEADETCAAQLKINHVKANAYKANKALKHAKIVLGAGVLLLPTPARASALASIFPMLIERDKKCLRKWFTEKEIDFSCPVVVDQSNAAPAPVDSASATEVAGQAIGKALQRTLEGMKEGELGLVMPDVLEHANDEDRAVLDAWLAKRDSSNA